MTALKLIVALIVQTESAASAEIELLLVENDAPVADVKLVVNGKPLGKTDSLGALAVRIPAGRSKLQLFKSNQSLLDIELRTDKDELVLIIASLTPGRPPELIIESSGDDSVLASESATSKTARNEPKTKPQPPGTLYGQVLTSQDKQPIPQAQLYFSGTPVEAVTNAAGEFRVELPAGLYSVSVVHPRFSSQTLEDIRVVVDQRTNLEVELNRAGVRLQDYVVTAPYVSGSVASVVEQQRTASGVSDVLGAAQISATGDSNAAEALTRVTGLTIEDGRFVLVRGQPSRFTLALFNGSELPSPEPLLRLVPLDLFPTGVLQGIEVQKSFTPDKPGSFGAGLVELTTRTIPDSNFLKLSLSTGFNTQSTFDDGLTYDGGNYDYFGFDDGVRSLPDAVAAATENGTRSLNSLPADEQAALSAEFPNILEQDETKLPPDLGVGIAGGMKFPIAWGGTFGILATGSFSNQWRYQQRIQRGNTLSRGELIPRVDLVENRTDNTATLSGLLSLSSVWTDHSISTNTFVVNQSQQRTEFTTGTDFTDSGEQLEVLRSLLSWIERSLLAQQVYGNHNFEWLEVEYRALYARANRDAPDRRTYEFGKTPEQDDFIVRRNSGLTRGYSFVRDVQTSFGLDLTFDPNTLFPGHKDWLLEPKVKIGVARSRIRREAGEQRFLWDIASGGDASLRSPEEVFDPTLVAEGELEFRDASLLGADDYNGDADVTGLFAQLDLKISDIARIVAGARSESATYSVDSFQLASIGGEVSTSGFEQDEVLPAALITWFASDDSQIRLAYGRSLSRPVFNEIAPSFFFDPDSGQQFQGEPDLLPTVIDGYEARFEWYPSTTESVTFGVFLKDYTNPIEQTFGAVGGGDLVATFQNASESQVMGVEAGGRLQLKRVDDWLSLGRILRNSYLSANIAVLDSEVVLNDEQVGVATSSIRRLQGQADIVVNAQAGYDGETLDITVAYNRVGEQLALIGVFGQPDYVQRPVDRLDINVVWKLTQDAQIRATGSNLLNARQTITQTGGEPVRTLVWRDFQQGRSFSLGFSYSFSSL